MTGRGDGGDEDLGPDESNSGPAAEAMRELPDVVELCTQIRESQDDQSDQHEGRERREDVKGYDLRVGSLGMIGKQGDVENVPSKRANACGRMDAALTVRHFSGLTSEV